MSHDYLEQEQNEVPSKALDRRTFLRLAGFTFAGTMLTGCESTGVEKAIPYLIKPEELTPGLAYWYASTCGGCTASCGILVKNRDGRPIKIDGNQQHGMSRGGLCAVGQASIFPLYDSTRLQHPALNGNQSTWEEVDKEILRTLDGIRKKKGSIRFLTGTITSPTTLHVIEEFARSYPGTKHITYDALSSSAILDAHKLTHGRRALPHYFFDRANVIVSFDADFLGTWISPVEFSAQFVSGRKLEENPAKFSYHVQIESRLSLTGSNADKRIAASPSEIRQMVTKLAALIEVKSGKRGDIPKVLTNYDEYLSTLADLLWNERSKSIVVSGVNDLQTQVLVNFINHALGNYGTTVDVEKPSRQRAGDDNALADLLKELKDEKVDALFIVGVNPIYDFAGNDSLPNLLKKVPLVVSVAERIDETSSLAHIVCPDHHFLESWLDNEPVEGIYTLTQPVITPLGTTRSFIESVSVWTGKPRKAYDAIRKYWETKIFKEQKKEKNFDALWDRTLQDGYFTTERSSRKEYRFNFSAVGMLNRSNMWDDSGDLSFILYPKVALLDGRTAHNPWLQELPDPVTKIVWDNYASLSAKTATSFGIKEGDVIEIVNGQTKIELPAHIQPGQAEGVIAMALGYGRMGTDRFTNVGPDWIEAHPTVSKGELVGKNVSVFRKNVNGHFVLEGKITSIKKTGRTRDLASTQEHHSIRVPEHLARKGMERRPIIQETTYSEFANDPSSGSFPKVPLYNLWPEEHKYEGHHWGMAIDLTACTGCSACAVGCMSENNIPVVGKDEVRRNREMNWLRIDRYYDEGGDELTVSHQPMMCHHCDHAPCETVCPVLATVHSDEGLNQQIYNRCVGTRYCSNNCPYKVRRFNWFDYPRGDEMHKLLLNPDVTVRERGVMEKCTFCVQRIQEAKIIAKKEGRSVKDGEIKVACEQSCPTKAIVFGDMNDPESEISKRMNSARHYKVLEEIGIRPSVGYLTLVRNTSEKGGSNRG